MRDEDQFPTVRFQKCKACGEVYTGSLSGENACPKCHTVADRIVSADNRFNFTVVNRKALIVVSGAVYKIQELEELKDEIDRALNEDIISLAFTFADTSLINSSLINVLVKTVQALSLQAKPTYIITSDKQILETFHMMGLDRVMRILPNLESYYSS